MLLIRKARPLLWDQPSPGEVRIERKEKRDDACGRRGAENEDGERGTWHGKRGKEWNLFQIKREELMR